MDKPSNEAGWKLSNVFIGLMVAHTSGGPYHSIFIFFFIFYTISFQELER